MVFDEADMLLSGGFEAPTRYILTLLQEADRASVVAGICTDLSISEQDFRSLPLLMRRTGLKGAIQDRDACLLCCWINPGLPTVCRHMSPSELLLVAQQ